MKLLNTDILANPFNWAVIVTMVLFSLFLMALIFPQGE